MVATAFWNHDFAVQQVMLKTLRGYFAAMRAEVLLNTEKDTLSQIEELLKGTKELSKAGIKGKTELLALELKEMTPSSV